MVDGFSFLACSSKYPLLVPLKNEQTNERANDRFIKAFPSLDGIDEYESSTSNNYDTLFLCVPTTYIHRHTKKCGMCLCTLGMRKASKRCAEEREKKRNGLKGNTSTSSV
jgi:hypothetical protein